MNPKYPIYIPSKSRFDSRLTSKALEKLNIPYKIVIEKEEFNDYAKHIDKDKILVLPLSSQGLVYSRNWIREHSIELGYKRHWQLDDNIQDFYRLNRSKRLHIDDGTIFRCAEDFSDRYKNVALSGFNYMGLCVPNKRTKPYLLNGRIYSITLCNNEMGYKWELAYNDDTDISLRVFKDGNCTILFNAFLADKAATMTVKGGLTENYTSNGRKETSKMLVDRHPDVCKLVYKWDRWHHHVNYKPFRKNKLIKVDNYDEIVKDGVDNYGMVLKYIGDE
tara:strand:- start:3185 stop:4015 length:831 start_codon:yes stop_codon:yes gene_type:complete